MKIKPKYVPVDGNYTTANNGIDSQLDSLRKSTNAGHDVGKKGALTNQSHYKSTLMPKQKSYLNISFFCTSTLKNTAANSIGKSPNPGYQSAQSNDSLPMSAVM